MTYNPAGDANCQAWYRMGDDTAITTDSSGKGNTLTNSTAADSATAWEGAHSADFELSESDYMYRTDANLSANFPGKSGTTSPVFTVCFAVRFETLPTAGNNRFSLVTKYDGPGNKRSWAIMAYYNGTGVVFELLIGHTGGTAAEVIDHATATVTTGQWYHVGVSWNDATKAYRIRVWDDGAGALLGSDKASTATNNMNVEDAAFAIGAYASAVPSVFHDGLIDDVVIFNRVLGTDEIDAVRAQTFGDTGGLSIPVAASYYDHLRRAE